MKKFLLIPDSFKGTMSSLEICEIMSHAIRCHQPEAKIVSIPVADGGEGSVDAFLHALGGEKKTVTVKGPYGEPVEGFYGLMGNTAVVEMAAAAGLPLVGDQLNPEKTTTYGVGELIKTALEEEQVTRLIVGLGGSATNDGGCGAAAALGVRFYDSTGNVFVPVGGTLSQIDRIDGSGRLSRLSEVEIITMCDIDNPLCGEQGAAAVFGPQKGADAAMVTRLDDGLRHLSSVIARDLHQDILEMPGAGAAGGMGAGMSAFLNATLKMGIETVLDVVRFEELAKDADMILTGEGRIDGQSLRGKVVVGIGRRAKKIEVPVVAIVGDIAPGAEQVYTQGVSGIFSINRLAVPYQQAKKTAPEDLYQTVFNLLHYTNQIR